MSFLQWILPGRYFVKPEMDTKTSMKAVTYNAHGDSSALQLTDAAPRPIIVNSQQALVKVYAAGVNPIGKLTSFYF